MQDNITIFNDDGDDLTISPDALMIQAVLLGVFKDGDQVNRRALLAVLKRTQNLLNALDNLAADKHNEEKKRGYLDAKRECETDALYYGKDLHPGATTAVQGELFATAAT